MEITKDAILRVVRAAQTSLNLSQLLGYIAYDCDTMADRIFGELAEALFMISGDTNSSDRFEKTKTYAILTDLDMSDEKATDAFMEMIQMHDVKQPAPILMTKEEREALYGETPEGEWR